MRGKGSACANVWKSDGTLGVEAGTKRGCQGTVRGEDGDTDEAWRPRSAVSVTGGEAKL